MSISPTFPDSVLVGIQGTGSEMVGKPNFRPGQSRILRSPSEKPMYGVNKEKSESGRSRSCVGSVSEFDKNANILLYKRVDRVRFF